MCIQNNIQYLFKSLQLNKSFPNSHIKIASTNIIILIAEKTDLVKFLFAHGYGAL